MIGEALGSSLFDTELRPVEGPSVECVRSVSIPLLGCESDNMSDIITSICAKL